MSAFRSNIGPLPMIPAARNKQLLSCLVVLFPNSKGRRRIRFTLNWNARQLPKAGFRTILMQDYCSQSASLSTAKDYNDPFSMLQFLFFCQCKMPYLVCQSYNWFVISLGEILHTHTLFTVYTHHSLFSYLSIFIIICSIHR